MTTLLQLIFTFFKVGASAFGGGMVMIAFLEQDVVNTFGWLTRREYIDAIALGQVTPGPIIITSVFVGYKALGLLGSVVAMTAICLPSFLLTIFVGQQLRRVRRNPTIQAFLKGVSPAVVGLIAGAGLSIARSSLVDIPTVLLAAVCLGAIIRFKVDSVLVVVAAGLIGAVFL
ncbi:MAG: chromate transporter [Chloroflexi bacterium]|nr:chromate transporter [Chloroflexota bacterium]MCL5108019.1 chromate transporter [Chloroflexota bacterium]